MAEVGALDLSAKHGSLKHVKRESPALSPASSNLEQDPAQDPYLQRLPPQRSASVSSGDGHDTDSSASGPSNGKPMIPVFPGMPPMIPLPHANLDLDPGELAALRGFKNPLDGFGGGVFPNIAMSQGQQGLFPGIGGCSLNSSMGLGAMGGLSTLGLMDTNPISLSSPITQYLQQRRRRSESRLHATSSATSTKPEDTPTSTPGPSTSVSPPSTSPITPQPATSAASFINTSSGNDIFDDEPEAKKSKSDGSSSTIEELRDNAYWDRRRKNNEAAKRSRDSRRAKEEEIALRAAFLEQENLKLRAQVAILKNETAKLHYMLYNRS